MTATALRAIPIAPETSSSPVIAGILRYLRERRLQPGDRLPSERDLADLLKVGRNAIREALATLITLRVVESRPNSGIYLRNLVRESSFEALVMFTDAGAIPTQQEVAETMEVRAHLETLAVRLACERRTDDDLARLADIVQRTDAIAAEGGNIAELDTEFHIALADSTHNTVLVRVLNAFYRFTAHRRVALFADSSQARTSAREHHRLLRCVRTRDTVKAQALILRHMDRARHYWAAILAD